MSVWRETTLGPSVSRLLAAPQIWTVVCGMCIAEMAAERGQIVYPRVCTRMTCGGYLDAVQPREDTKSNGKIVHQNPRIPNRGR